MVVRKAQKKEHGSRTPLVLKKRRLRAPSTVIGPLLLSPVKRSRAPRTARDAVDSLPHFVATVCELHKAWRSEEPGTPRWFRGQGDADKPLRPTLYRDETGDLDESELRYEFERRAVQFPLPRTPNKGTRVAAVWALDPWWLNQHVLRRNGTLTQLRTRQRDLVRVLLPDPKDDRKNKRRRRAETALNVITISLPDGGAIRG